MLTFLPAGLPLVASLPEGYGQCDSCAQHMCGPDINTLCVFACPYPTQPPLSAMRWLPAAVCMSPVFCRLLDGSVRNLLSL